MDTDSHSAKIPQPIASLSHSLTASVSCSFYPTRETEAINKNWGEIHFINISYSNALG